MKLDEAKELIKKRAGSSRIPDFLFKHPKEVFSPEDLVDALGITESQAYHTSKRLAKLGQIGMLNLEKRFILFGTNQAVEALKKEIEWK